MAASTPIEGLGPSGLHEKDAGGSYRQRLSCLWVFSPVAVSQQFSWAKGLRAYSQQLTRTVMPVAWITRAWFGSAPPVGWDD